MSTRMQQRRGTAAQWISTNSGNGPILAAGEIGFESDNNRFKIGDGVNHWVDLPYFANNEAISDLIDGAPDLLNTLNELAAAMGDDPAFLATLNTAIGDVESALSAHESDTTNVHGVADFADLATIEYVDTAVGNSTVDQSSLAGTGIDWNATTEQFDIDSTVATVTYVAGEVSTHSSDTTSVHGIADTANLATKTYADGAVSTHSSDTTSVHGIADTENLATKTYADGAVSTHSSDTTSVHGIADTSALATKTFAANLLLEATKTNISITGDIDGLTITAENGVADATTDALTEGTNNLYFTAERAQDAIGSLVGTGLEYNDATGAIAVDTAEIQVRVAGISDTEIGYLNGVTSGIQTQLDAKAPVASPTFTGTVSGITKTMVGLSDVNNTSDAAKPVSTAAQTALDLKAPLASPTFTGTVSGVTKSMVGLGSVDNTADADKPVSSAAQTALNAKLSLAGGTMTGAIAMGTNKITGLGAPIDDSDAATKAYVDAVSEGLHIHASVIAATTANINLANAVENGDVLDGITLATGNRILVKNQTNQAENGIYVVQASGQPVRATDFDTALEVNSGDFVFVSGGTLNGASGYAQINSPAVIGTDAIDFEQFSGAGTFLAGNGLTLTGNTFTIDTAITQARVANVSDVEIGYLDGVTSAIQTQIDSKLASATASSTYAPIASPTFTGTVAGITKSMVGLANVDNTSDAAKPVSTATQTALDTKASALATVNAQNASYTLVLSDKDKVVEINIGSGNTITVPLDASVNFPVGTQIDILQVGSGQTTVVATGGVTVNATPGLKLRTQWAGATLRKRAANTWVLVGDLTA